jgi:hypothetical protein
MASPDSPGSSELRSVFGQNPRDRQQLVLNRLLKGQELLFELIRKTNGPRHLLYSPESI